MARHKYEKVFQDGQGNAVASGTVSVYLTGTSTAASVYAAEAGGSTISSTTSESDGVFSFWVDDSTYSNHAQLFRLVLSKTGLQSKTYDNVRLYPPSSTEVYLGSVAGKTVDDLFDGGYDVTIKPEISIVRDPYIDVRSYGVGTDGTTDYSTELQNALTAASGKILLIPVGTYRHSVLLTIPSNITIYGYGAVIKATDSLSKTVGGMSISSQTNVQIFGLTYDGNRANRTPGTPVGSAHGVYITNSSSVVLRDVTVKNGVADGVYLGYSDSGDANTRVFNSQIYGGRYTNCYRNNVSVVGGVNIKFYGSRFDTANGTAPQAGVDVEADNATICNEDVEFFGCTSDSNAGSGFAITNNSKRSRIFGGASKSNSQHGIDMSQTANVDSLIEGIAVTGNGTGGAGYYGIYSSATRAQLRNNEVHSNSNEGIYLSGSATYNRIIGNTVYSNAQGIYAQGSNNEVYDNISYDNTSVSGWNIYIGGNNGRVQRNKSINSLGASGAYGMSINSTTNVVCTDNIVTGAQANGGLQIIGRANASIWRDNLDVSGGTPYNNWPVFSVNNNAVGIALTASTWTKLTWSTEEFDVGDTFASNKFTPAIAGYYQLNFSVYITGLVAGKLAQVAVYKNGVADKVGAYQYQQTTGDMAINGSVVVQSDTNDYFEIYAYHNDTIDRNTSGAVVNTYFNGSRIG